MNDILKDMIAARELISDIDPATNSFEVHPVLYRDLCKAFDPIWLCSTSSWLTVWGFKLLTNPKLKHWACLVRDAQGKVIKVLRIGR